MVSHDGSFRVHLVHFESSDRLNLPGLLFEPLQRTKKAAIFLHGNGDSSVFYTDRTNVMGEAMTRRGVAWLAFNNRGAHLSRRLTRRKGREKESVEMGTTFELIRDCVHDIDGAVRFLVSKGYQEFYLVGHSTGANKIAVYDRYRKRNRVSGYVLLGGGDDTGLYYQSLGSVRFKRALREAKLKVKQGRGRELAPPSVAPFPLSNQSLADTIDPDGDYNIFPFYEVLHDIALSKKERFGELRSIRKPTLVLYGSEDEFCFGDVKRCVRILETQFEGKANFELRILDGADHGFHGREREMATLVARWLSSSARF